MINFYESSPPGWSGTVKAMKLHHKKEIDNPYALSWYMKNKGDKAHYKPMKDNSSKSKGKPSKKKKFKEFLTEKGWKFDECNRGSNCPCCNTNKMILLNNKKSKKQKKT